jgi:hypothetical protein
MGKNANPESVLSIGGGPLDILFIQPFAAVIDERE